MCQRSYIDGESTGSLATDLKCQMRLVEGVFIESFYPTIENTFSKTIKHRKQGF